MAAGERRRSSTSRDPLTYAIRATNADGTAWSPGVGATFQAAYLATPGDPVEADWRAGTFGVTRIGTVVGLCDVGPGGTVSLAKGRWYEWARLTDVSVGIDKKACVGTLIVE